MSRIAAAVLTGLGALAVAIGWETVSTMPPELVVNSDAVPAVTIGELGLLAVASGLPAWLVPPLRRRLSLLAWTAIVAFAGALVGAYFLLRVPFPWWHDVRYAGSFRALLACALVSLVGSMAQIAHAPHRGWGAMAVASVAVPMLTLLAMWLEALGHMH